MRSANELSAPPGPPGGGGGPPVDDEPWVDAETAAVAVGLSPKTLYRLANANIGFPATASALAIGVSAFPS
jgi:hypothetical protein